jgi:hypothetical protein
MSNILTSLDGLVWLLGMLLPLVFLQRFLHREIQSVFLIFTRRPGVTQVVFALIFFPGVVLHELSHFLVAKILGVQTGRFSLIPHATIDGRLQLGYVETGSGGLLRDALIGMAPLLTGCLFVAYAAVYRMQLLPLWEFMRTGSWDIFWMSLGRLPSIPDFWIWFYLTFTVSSTMMPSASDRHAWLPLGVIAGVLFILTLIVGAGPWMLVNLAPPFNDFLRALALIFGLSAAVHLILAFPILLLHRVLSRLTGLDVG